MPFDPTVFHESVIPVSIVVGAILLGLLFEKIVLYEVKKVAARTTWEGDEVIVHALNGIVILWFILGGFYGALRYIELPPAVLVIVHKILKLLAILSMTIVAARMAVGFVDVYSRKLGGALATTSIFDNLTRVLVFIIGGLIMLEALGISITPILTALGVGGLAVALALQDTLSNVFAGIHVIASRKIRPGDYVKLESGQEGHIHDITWRYTTIQTLTNNLVVVPNAKLASALVTNYSMPDGQIAVTVSVGVSYDSDLEKVEAVTIEVARELMKEIPGGVPDFEPVIRYHTFGEFSIQFNVALRAQGFVDQYLLKHEFIKRLHHRYRKEGIIIPFPIRTVYMEKNESE
ncbi:MAG: mechanosensitive ion channel family protein [Deltaproteobacteria bacterium]|nr:mechanosensitive ion channel family protein [Deltaproteobacteria bacterium]